MTVRKDSVRGRVITKWERSRRPIWNSRKTVEVCIEMDRELEVESLNPARKFRKAIKRNDEKYLKVWVFGCHFSWVNPR